MYLGRERNVRADCLLYLLQGALDDIHVEYIKMRDGLAPLPLSKEDKLRKRRAAAVPLEHALSMATPLLDEKKVLHTQGIGEQATSVNSKIAVHSMHYSKLFSSTVYRQVI